MLPGTLWSGGCDFLKFVSDTKMSKRKIIWHISGCFSQIMVVMKINKYVKHSYFILKAWKLTILLLRYCVLWFFDNKCCTTQSVDSEINMKISKERDWILNNIKRTLCQILSCPRMEQRGIYGQNVFNVILLVLGLCSARVNHYADFCIFGLSNTIPLHHPTKAFI